MVKKSKRHDVDENNQSLTGFNVSQSKVKTYRKCHYAYYLKYVEKLRKKVKSRPLQFGTIVHRMVEANAEGDDPMDVLIEIEKENSKMFRAEKEMYGEIIEDARQIMTEYFAYYPEKDFRFERRDGKSGEHQFNIELVDYGLKEVFWNGKIDATGKTPNKLRWLMEHKTFSRRPSDDERWRNIQSCTYLRAVDILGWGAYDGMCWDYIRSKPPTRPGILKDGNLSQKSIDSLPITIRQTIAEEGLKERDYKSFLQRSQENLNSWFFRIHTPVNERVIDSVFDDFIHTIREMRDNQENPKKDKNIDRHCSWCDFEPICRAEMQGDDTDYVKQKEYTVGKDDQQEPALTDSAE